MELSRFVVAWALAYGAASAMGAEDSVRFATSRTRQSTAPATPKLSVEQDPDLSVEGRNAEESPAEQISTPAAASGVSDPFLYATTQGTGIPSSPYIAGLSYMMTPQPFRVPIPNRFYYPPAHYVHRCPYYPRGYYWGANWNRRFLPANDLIHGQFRFNPYLSAVKVKGQPGGGNHACVPAASPEMPAFPFASATRPRSTEAVAPSATGETPPEALAAGSQKAAAESSRR
jgi:hypothetical protein